MSNVVALDKEQHRNLKVIVDSDFGHADTAHLVPLTASEYVLAATSYPIVLIKDGQTGRFCSVGLLGLVEGENLFYADKQWHTVYIPNSITQAPFYLGPDIDCEKTLVVYIDLHSSYVSYTQGEALFEANGNDSEYLSKVRTSLSRLYNAEIATERFVSRLNEWNLLQRIELTIRMDGCETYKIDGLYTINDVKLQSLNSDELLELHEKGYVMPISAMIISLGQIRRLILQRGTKNTDKVTRIDMRPIP